MTPYNVRNTAAAAVAAACCLVPAALAAQGRVVPAPPPTADTVTVVPGPRYQAGGLHSWLLGSDWREIWNVPLTLPVLDIETFAGGLTPESQGGGNQSVTLHMVDPEGRSWIFRSMDKYPGDKLDMGGLVDWLVQDQVSALHPGGQLVVPALLDALGILHVEPTLYVVPDDPALGEFRETFAGMVGALELIPNEGPDDTPGWAGSTKITAWDALAERLEESPIHEVDQRELLRARFLDFIIGDNDRGTDQWRWAGFDHPEDPGRRIWRPIPRDRDWTFVSGDGALGPAFRFLYPKHVRFEPRIPNIVAVTFSSHIVDRTLLTRLTREDFRREAATVQRQLTDGVLRDAVDRLPPRYPADHRQRLVETLRARRDDLPRAAMAFYDWLAMAVDVHATDQADRAEVVRREDGSLELTLGLRDAAVATASEDGAAGLSPYYRRVFLPSETNEVRVFLHGDDDLAIVRGPSDAIPVRIIGGGSDDVLADSSGAGSVHFYDDRGDNTFIRSRGTTVSTRSFDPPPVPEGIRLGSSWAPDYGDDFGWAPAVDFQEYGGVVVGFGPEWVDYGFRRLPHHWSLRVTPLFATSAMKPGAELAFDYRFESSLHSFELDARWSEFDAIRWFGLGNATELVDQDLSLVPLDRIQIDPSLVLRFGTWRSGSEDEREGIVIEDHTPQGFRAALSIGPVVEYTGPEPRAGSPFALGDAPTDPVWEYGLRAGAHLQDVDRDAAPRRGYRVDVTADGYPGLDDDTEAFGTGRATLRGYVPLIGESHLALRLGGLRAWGETPPWRTPTVGGRATVRGFEFMRFAGDAAAFGNAELRVPLTTVSWLVRGELGVLGLADAGRVWVDGDSAGDWHTAFGGGAWFAGGGQTVSLYYASGERDQLYLSLGMPF